MRSRLQAAPAGVNKTLYVFYKNAQTCAKRKTSKEFLRLRFVEVQRHVN